MTLGGCMAPQAEAILKSPGNDQCFDCEEACESSPWVSITYGIVVCLKCAGIHRSLGVHISYVRSLELDSLKDEEADLILQHGNVQFTNFLSDPTIGIARKIWLAMPLDIRYFTPAADLYRRQLRAKLEGVELPTTMASVKPSAKLARPAARQSRWTPDSDAQTCELCRVSFTLLRRRHHCRRCGRCVCAECSPPESWRPTAESSQPLRTCKLCEPPAAQLMPGM